MKLFFDQNLSFRLCHCLSDIYPESIQARLAGMAEAVDREIWEYAKMAGYTLKFYC